MGIRNEDLTDVSAIVDYEYKVAICNEAHGVDFDWSSVLDSYPYIIHYVLQLEDQYLYLSNRLIPVLIYI